MSEAILNLVSREALELHFQGITYGPIEHTQALGVLLFALRPARVRCATPAGAFQAAMRNVLAAAQETATLLDVWAGEEDEDDDARDDPRRAHLPVWIDAACRAAAGQHARALHAGLANRLGPQALHPVVH